MRRNTRHSFWLLAGLVSLLTFGVGPDANAGEPDDGLDLYFRDAPLLDPTEQALPKYPDADPGESKLLPRDFPDAPPQISHAVEDMLPITGDDNECLECHHPENAVEASDVPLPESHFEAPVMGAGGKNDAMLWVVKDYEKGDDLSGARYNCSTCHTSQATNVRTPASSFVPAKKK